MTAAAPAVGSSYRVFEAAKEEKGPVLRLAERKVAELKAGEVLVKVLACGVCQGDVVAVLGHYPTHKYPAVPGHEVVGTVVAVGSGVSRFKVGDYVGRGWHGGHCQQCRSCSTGDAQWCAKAKATGIDSEGGYAEFMVAPVESLAQVPKELAPEDAAPLMNAGLTVYSGLRSAKAKPGSLVAVQGIGGLGHYAVQFARAMGFFTVAISHGSDKESLAKTLGAHEFIDSSKQNAVAELKKLGGASVILSTVTDSKAMSALVDGLAPRGTLVLLGADFKSLEISPFQLIAASKSVVGVTSGLPSDAEETMKFAVLAKVRSYVEVFAFENTKEAYAHMLSNKQRFRVVVSHTGAKSAGGVPFPRGGL